MSTDEDDTTHENESDDVASAESGFAPSARYEAGRPKRPPVLPARVAPKLRPPEAPAPLHWAATSWRVTALTLGLAVGLVFLDVLDRKRVVRDLLAERAAGMSEEDVNLATNILFFGSLLTWGALAIVALIVARGITQPVLRPRTLAIGLAVSILGVLLFTAFPLTAASGLGLGARLSLAVASVAASVAASAGLTRGTWAWAREHRGQHVARRASATPPAPPPPPPDR